jgi:hypothetical protein
MSVPERTRRPRSGWQQNGAEAESRKSCRAAGHPGSPSRPDAVRRTLALLHARLAGLHARPPASTGQLAASLLGAGQTQRRRQPWPAAPASRCPAPGSMGAAPDDPRQATCSWSPSRTGSIPRPQARYRHRTGPNPPSGASASAPRAADSRPHDTGNRQGTRPPKARGEARETPPRESRTRRPFRTASYSVLHSVYLPTPESPGPGECAGSARNKPSRELPDLYTCTARKTIVIGAPGK